MVNTLQSEVIVTNVYEKNLEAYESKQYRVIANQGSTRSTKTYSVCQLLALYIPALHRKSISIVGPSLPHLKRGARRDFLDVLESANKYSDNNFNKTDNVYYYPKRGSYVEFFGAEDLGKVRGPGRDILFVNEANLLPFNIYKQLALRTKEIIFLDFNPVDESSWVYDVADAPGNLLIHSTYKDNPFLSREQREEIEGLEHIDDNLWKIFGLGLRGVSSEIIYTHWKKCSEIPENADVVYGCDFGYNNPTALIKVGIKDQEVYVDEQLYETKLTTGDLVERMIMMGIQKYADIYCDNAEPKSIEELRRAGFNAKPCEKKDVREGIRKVRSMELHITERSANIIKEVRSYKWKIDKDGKVIDEPVKFLDHSMDAIRYAVFTHLAQPRYTWVAR